MRIWNSPIIKKIEGIQSSEELLEARLVGVIIKLEEQVRSMPDSAEKRVAENKLAALNERLSREAAKAAKWHRAEERRLKGSR